MSRETFLRYIRNSDARTESDFPLYRVETAALVRLIDIRDSAFLAVGLKGIGKTASFRTLSDPSSGDVVQAISATTQEPQDVSVSRPTLQYVQEIKAELVLQSLIALVQQLKTSPPLRAKIPQHVQQDAQVFVVGVWDRLKDVFGGLGGVTVLGCGISFRNKSKGANERRLIPRDDLSKSTGILREAAKTTTFRIVVDDPEAIFCASKEINENLVAALAIAASELRNEVENFKCVILIKPNVLRALRVVDEFANIPLNSRVKLSWSDEELKDVVRNRAKAANVELSEVFGADPEPALEMIVKDSRSGPRDALRRLELHYDTYPRDPVTPTNLEKSRGSYSEACYDQMVAAYERQYPGLSQASLIVFEGQETEIAKSALATRFDQMIAGSPEILASKDQEWARDAVRFADLLVQFGLIAVKTGNKLVLPYHSNYAEEAAQTDAVYTYLPALRGRIRFLPKGPTETPGRRKMR